MKTEDIVQDFFKLALQRFQPRDYKKLQTWGEIQVYLTYAQYSLLQKAYTAEGQTTKKELRWNDDVIGSWELKTRPTRSLEKSYSIEFLIPVSKREYLYSLLISSHWEDSNAGSTHQ